MLSKNQTPSPNSSEARNSSSVESDDFEEFIYLLSHDFRNSTRALLEVPLWIAEDLETAGHRVDASINENLDLMRIHTHRLDQMLSDLLIYSRVGRKQNLQIVELQDIYDAVLETLEVPENISIDCSFQVDQINMGDRDIQTLMYSLLSNSIKHSDPATTFATVSTHEINDTILLFVDDDGPGIQEKYRDRVLEAMITLKPRDDVEGSGMGLTISRKIANYYGGQIRLLDRPSGRGLRVEVTVPTKIG